MHLSEVQSSKPVLVSGWLSEEECVITTIQQAESAPRAEATRRMKGRKTTSRAIVGGPPVQTAQHLCRQAFSA